MYTRQHKFSVVMVVMFTIGLLLTGYVQAAEKPIVLRYAAGVTRDAIYDLASLSAVAGASGAMLAAESGAWQMRWAGAWRY
jgi:predicted cation transporter